MSERRVVSRLVIVLSALFAWACHAAPARPESGGTKMRNIAVDVSIIALVANPSRFDGLYVRTVAIVSSEFEDRAAYPNTDAYKAADTTSSVRLSLLDQSQLEAAQRFEGKAVIVEGTFRASKVENPTDPTPAGTIEQATLRPNAGR